MTTIPHFYMVEITLKHYIKAGECSYSVGSLKDPTFQPSSVDPPNHDEVVEHLMTCLLL